MHALSLYVFFSLSLYLSLALLLCLLLIACSPAISANSCMPPTLEGPPDLCIYDLHNGTTRFSFTNQTRYWPQSNVPELLREMTQWCGAGNFAVVFPDEGSYKRFRALMPEKQAFMVCSKIRAGDKRIVHIVDRYPPNLVLNSFEQVVIVDDLVQSGGTIHECHMALKQEGARRVSAYVTHAVFPKQAFRHFMPGGKWAGLERFLFSDSVPPHADLLWDQPPFQVLSLARPLISDLRLRHETPELPTLLITVASKNRDKLTAVENALAQVFVDYRLDIRGVEADSGVSAQPLSMAETEQGAHNRLRVIMSSTSSTSAPDAETKDDTLQLFVAMENGLEVTENEQRADASEVKDVGVVLLSSKPGRARARACGSSVTSAHDHWAPLVLQARTRAVAVDLSIFSQFQQLVKKEPGLTVGKVYERDKGYDASNWHLPVAGVNRSYLLQQALQTLLRQLEL